MRTYGHVGCFILRSNSIGNSTDLFTESALPAPIEIFVHSSREHTPAGSRPIDRATHELRLDHQVMETARTVAVKTTTSTGSRLCQPNSIAIGHMGSGSHFNPQGNFELLYICLGHVGTMQHCSESTPHLCLQESQESYLGQLYQNYVSVHKQNERLSGSPGNPRGFHGVLELFQLLLDRL